MTRSRVFRQPSTDCRPAGGEAISMKSMPDAAMISLQVWKSSRLAWRGTA